LGNLDAVKVGDDAHAIGHPIEQLWTYTKGYVSQIRRGYDWQNQGENFHHKADVVQTQTPINPGNSGGPLLNSQGLLIGVNAFGAPNAQGLNYAIAVDEVKIFLEEPEPPRPAATADAGGAANASAAAPAQAPACEPHLLFEGRNKENT